MSTRCFISRQNPDGSLTYIYCHNDGYIEGGVGEMLETNYADPDKIDQLMSLGDISYLGVNPIDPGNLWDIATCLQSPGLTKDYTRSYASRGENVPANQASSFDEMKKFAEDAWCEYIHTYYHETGWDHYQI